MKILSSPAASPLLSSSSAAGTAADGAAPSGGGFDDLLSGLGARDDGSSASKSDASASEATAEPASAGSLALGTGLGGMTRLAAAMAQVAGSSSGARPQAATAAQDGSAVETKAQATLGSISENASALLGSKPSPSTGLQTGVSAGSPVDGSAKTPGQNSFRAAAMSRSQTVADALQFPTSTDPVASAVADTSELSSTSSAKSTKSAQADDADQDASADPLASSSDVSTPAGLLALLATTFASPTTGTAVPALAQTAAGGSPGSSLTNAVDVLGASSALTRQQADATDIGAPISASLASSSTASDDGLAIVPANVGATAQNAAAPNLAALALPNLNSVQGADGTAALGVANVTMQAHLAPSPTSASSSLSPAASATTASPASALQFAGVITQTGSSATAGTPANNAIRSKTSTGPSPSLGVSASSSKMPSDVSGAAGPTGAADAVGAAGAAGALNAAAHLPAAATAISTPTDADTAAAHAASTAAAALEDATTSVNASTDDSDAVTTLSTSTATTLNGVSPTQLDSAALPPFRAIANAVMTLAAQEPASNAASSTDPASVSSSLASARTMTLQLSPQHLGTVSVRLHVTGHTLDVDLSIASDQTLGLVSRDRDALVNALRDQNYDLNSLTIQSTGASSGSSGDQNAQYQGSQADGTASGGRQSGSGNNNGSSDGRPASSGQRAPREEPSPAADRSAEPGLSSLFV